MTSGLPTARIHIGSASSPVACGVAALLVWAAFGASIANPIVIADEVQFLITGLSGRGLRAAQAQGAVVQDNGALLYAWVIGLLDAARLPVQVTLKVVNAACFAMGAALAAQVAGGPRPDRRRLLMALWLALSPLGTYAAFILPETALLLLFALLVWRLARGTGANAAARAASAGALIGAMTLLKPTALVVALALAFAIGAWPFLSRGRFASAAIRLAAAAAAFAVVAVLGFWLLPTLFLGGATSVVGGRYTAQLVSASDQIGHLASGIALSGRYAIALMVLCAPAVTVLAYALVQRARTRDASRDDPALFAGLFVLATVLLLLIAAPQGVAMEPERIHLRYISFAAFLIAPLALRLGQAWPPSKLARWVAAAAWAVAALAMLSILPHYRALPVDAPELFFLDPGGGPLGLERLPVIGLIVPIAAGALAIASGRVHWATAQLVVLLAFSALAIPKLFHVEREWAEAQRPERSLGRLAREVCAAGAQTLAVGTPDNFVSLYVPLYMLQRPVPLVVEREPEARTKLTSLGRGDCLLTTLRDTPPGAVTLGSSPTARLLRIQ